MKWIPIDILPMKPDPDVVYESHTYLATDGHIVSTAEFSRGNGVGHPWAAWSEYSGIRASMITHWMPLPSPPNKEGAT